MYSNNPQLGAQTGGGAHLPAIFDFIHGRLREQYNRAHPNQNQNQMAPVNAAQGYYGDQTYDQAMKDWAERMGQMKDPQQYINAIMGGYQASPWAQEQQRQMREATLASDAASGMTGSGAEKEELMKRAQAISSQDQQNWLNQNLGLNRDYLSGNYNMVQTGQGERQLDFQRRNSAEQNELARQQLQNQIDEFNQQLGYAQDASDKGSASSLIGSGLGFASGTGVAKKFMGKN